MYNLSYHSKREIRGCHPWLQLILFKLLSRHDYKAEQGKRTWDEQQAVYDSGNSTLAPPEGKHLIRSDPAGQFDGDWSLAVDVYPYINGRPIATDADNFGPDQMAQFAYFLGIVKELADEVLQDTGWKIRLGINWDGDAEIITDQDFDDWFHIELVWMGTGL